MISSQVTKTEGGDPSQKEKYIRVAETVFKVELYFGVLLGILFWLMFIVMDESADGGLNASNIVHSLPSLVGIMAFLIIPPYVLGKYFHKKNLWILLLLFLWTCLYGVGVITLPFCIYQVYLIFKLTYLLIRPIYG